MKQDYRPYKFVQDCIEIRNKVDAKHWATKAPKLRNFPCVGLGEIPSWVIAYNSFKKALMVKSK